MMESEDVSGSSCGVVEDDDVRRRWTRFYK